MLIDSIDIYTTSPHPLETVVKKRRVGWGGVL
jgi:hypothetical protein